MGAPPLAYARQSRTAGDRQRKPVTGERESQKYMSCGREKQNAVSKYPAAYAKQSQRAA